MRFDDKISVQFVIIFLHFEIRYFLAIRPRISIYLYGAI